MAAKSSNVRAPIAANASTSSDPRDLELLTTLQLVLFLMSTSKKSDFREVSWILSSREKSMRARNVMLESTCWTLEAENSFLKARCDEMKEKLEKGDDEYRTKIDDLELMVSEERARYALLEGACGELDIEMLEAREEADRYRMENQRIKKTMKWVDQRGRERIASLLKEIERKEKELEVWCFDLAEENRGLIEKIEMIGKQQSDDQSMCGANYDCRNSCETRHLPGQEKPLFSKPSSDGSSKDLHTEPASHESPKTIHYEHRNANAVWNNNHSIQETITIHDEDDFIPIGCRRKMKRYFEAIEESSEPTNPSMHQSFGCNDTATHCRDHFVPLRPCKRVKDEAKTKKRTMVE